ncbi:MAG: PulJ/GspJ family protein [Phycisphaerae bacterium]
MSEPTGHTVLRNRRRGLTLAELMVSVAVLSVIAVTFTTILSQSQRVVSMSQQTMRANANAAAIAQTIQKDFRRLTHNGFLRIAGPRDDQRLYLVCAGPSRSVTGGPMGTGSIVSYGLCDNPNGNGKVLYRTAWVLHREDTDPPDFERHNDYPDVIRADLADVQRLGHLGMRDLIDDELEELYPRSLAVPPGDLDEINDLWMVLTDNVEEVEFAFTTGETDGDGELEWISGANLWTSEDLENWPQAFRIRLQLTEELLPAGAAPLTYELVVPVRRSPAGLDEAPSGGNGWN